MRRRRWRRLLFASIAVAVAVAALLAVCAREETVRADAFRPVMTTVPASHGLGGAAAVAVAGSHVWVASAASDGRGSVTELNASNGRWLRTISGDGYGLRYPSGIAADGRDIWITNEPQIGDGKTPKPGDGTVTELDSSTGRLVRILTGQGYKFDFPGPIAAVGSDLWIANAWGGPLGNGDLVEVNASTGALVRIVSAAAINQPADIATRGSDLWVINSLFDDNGSVTEINTRTGRVTWTAKGKQYGFVDPISITADGNRLWVANLYAGGEGGSVTELDASTGRWIQTLSGGCYGFDSPAGITAAGNRIWVANSYIDADGGSVTELSASTGRWIQTLSSDTWIQNLLASRSCAQDLLTGGYSFANPALIAAVSSRAWIFDGPITILQPR